MQPTVSGLTSERKPLLKKSISYDHQNNNQSSHLINIGSSKNNRPRSQSLRELVSSTNKDKIVSGVRVAPRKQSTIRKPSGRRFVEKDGERNVRSREFPHERYIQDIFTTLINAKWKWIVTLFTIFYLGSWLTFGFFWWLILIVSGTKCMDNVTNFTDAFLLSVETSMTIGYGGRQVKSECPHAVILLIIQASLSTLTDAVIMGLIYSKVARPGKRQNTILFSEKAVVNKRDNKYCFMFNVADVRKKQLVECHVRLHLFRKYKTLEGQIISQHDQLRIGMDWNNLRDESDRVFLMKPCQLVHVIDRKSPLYYMSKAKYMSSDWELVVILEGIVEATGCTLQTRTSYLPSEVLWGYEFEDIANKWTAAEGVLYTLSDINNVEPSPYVMPECSAHDYYKQIMKEPEPNDVYAEQDELWDDGNFINPGDDVNGNEKRVFPPKRALWSINSDDPFAYENPMVTRSDDSFI